jgi:serine/threonine protein kinase
MFVLSLCRQLCPDKLPVQPEERLGDGADGEILTIEGQPDRVIKLGIIYEHPARELKVYKQIQRVLDYVMIIQPVAFVRVYEHGYLGTYSRKVVEWRKDHQQFLIYYYIMEKLTKLNEDEKKVFHSIISHEDRGINKNYSLEKIGEMLQGMSRGLDFDTDKVILFCQNLQTSQLSHQDLHPRNIMKDAVGNYKLADLDRAQIGEYYVETSS